MSNVSSGLISGWLTVSGLSFLFSLILNGVLIYVVVAKVLPAISDLTKKLNDLTDKVNGVATKVDTITTTAKSTVDIIHAKTTSILGTAEAASADVTKKVSNASTVLTGVVMAVKLMNAMKEIKAAQGPKAPTETPK